MIYVARSSDLPAPAAEARGLLLLSRADVTYLTTPPCPTLTEFTARGGRSLLAQPLPLDMPLVPFAQLRWLARMLRWHPELLPT